MSEEWLNQYWQLLVVGGLWEVIWKGLALWRAAKQDSKSWFVVLLLVNTLGILPIAYLFIFSKDSKEGSDTK